MPRPVRILFGTETGNAEGCADELLEGVKALGVPAELTDMDDYERDELADEDLVLIVTSTFGNGDPPYNAFEMMEFLKSPDAPELGSVRFSVCGLGDKSYPNFAQCGRDFDARFEALGAERVVPRMDCDVDFEVPFDTWKGQVLAWLRANHPDAGSAPVAAPKPAKGGLFSRVAGLFGGKKAAPEPTPTPAPSRPAAAQRELRGQWTRDNPFVARLISARRLNGPGSAKETMHYELDLTGSDIHYHCGDSFGVVPTNPPSEVDAVLAGARLDGDTVVVLRDGSSVPLRHVLSRLASLQTVTVDFLRGVAANGGPGKIALDFGPEAISAYLHDRFVADVLRDHPDAGITPQFLLDHLRHIHPRLYSVGSSPLADPNRVAFVAETLRYERMGRPCEGVATTWLADRVGEGGEVPLYLVANADFRLPAPDVDMLMIGPGTGIAPFRAFLQQRAADPGSGRSWLFFGHQHQASDRLYGDELDAWLASGVLTRVDYAWSRDQPEKIYVQDKLRASGAEVWGWLQGGAHVFVCGDAKGMAPGVHQALLDIATNHGGLDAAAAAAWLDGLTTAHRYHRDVY
jgi:sulfite reductase (NADPH) flavoprotein alpha-component